MLRLRPTVISVTPIEVTEVIHRRRFRKYLAETDDIRTKSQLHNLLDEPAAIGTLEQETTPQTDREKSVISPRESRTVVSPGDSAVSSPFQEDFLPLPELSIRRGRHEQAGDDDSPSRTPLCLRPKPVADPGDGTAFGASPVTSPPSTPRRQSPDRGRSRRWRKAISFSSASAAGFTNPRLSRSTERAMSPSPPPPYSIRTPVDGTDDGRYSSIRRVNPRRSLSLGSYANPRSAVALFGRAPPSRAPSGFHVFSDFLPASFQPRTPLNLPGARHQSRLHSSYTAPTRRTSQRPVDTPTTSYARQHHGRVREPSPLGLQTPGFQGLYGGTENMDDSILFEQAMLDLQAGVSRVNREG